VVLAARSLGTVEGVLCVDEVNSELDGCTIPMTRRELDELIRLLTSYYVGYTEVSGRHSRTILLLIV
jgi:hypothetical protein